MVVKKKSKEDNKVVAAVILSSALAALFLFNILVLVQDLKQGFQGAANSYALWPALALAIYAFVKSSNKVIRYTAVVVITVLAVGILVWLLGVTNAVNLRTNY